MDNLTFSQREGTLTAHLFGELDHHTSSFVREQIDACIYKLRPTSFVLDLSGTNFMDSSGLGLIMGRLTLCRNVGCAFFLSGADERALKILSLAGMDKAVKLCK